MPKQLPTVTMVLKHSTVVSEEELAFCVLPVWMQMGQMHTPEVTKPLLKCHEIAHIIFTFYITT